MTKLDPQQIAFLLEHYFIPCQPAALEALEREFARPKVDLEVIALYINSDVMCSAAVLQVANSTLFRKRFPKNKYFVSTIDAVHCIGQKWTQKLVQVIAKRDHALKGNVDYLKHFWDMALYVAAVSAHLAQRLICVPPDEGFLMGLLRECGVPYLMQRFEGYGKIYESLSSLDPVGLLKAEELECGVNHQGLGYCIARYWNLPEVICRAILNRHYIEPLSRDLSSVNLHKNVLNALVFISELVVYRHRNCPLPKSRNPEERWPDIHPNILGHLDIAQLDLYELMDDTLEKVEALLLDYKP